MRPRRSSSSCSRTGRATSSVPAVVDDGPGIDPADVPHVFERLYVSRTSPGRSLGTGIGLAIVRELAAAMGGQTWVEPADGTGATLRRPAPRGARLTQSRSGSGSTTTGAPPTVAAAGGTTSCAHVAQRDPAPPSSSPPRPLRRRPRPRRRARARATRPRPDPPQVPVARDRASRCGRRAPGRGSSLW